VLAPIWLLRGEIPGGNLISLLLVTSVSAVFYLLIAKLLKISEVTDLLKVIWSRKV
jgi:putative peptidoglycan lipid II flippase